MIHQIIQKSAYQNVLNMYNKQDYHRKNYFKEGINSFNTLDCRMIHFYIKLQGRWVIQINTNCFEKWEVNLLLLKVLQIPQFDISFGLR
jgi:hypothetical protein